MRRTIDEIPGCTSRRCARPQPRSAAVSATWSAISTSPPSEAQVIADRHGNVVVGTGTARFQRRLKLVEAPHRSLTGFQRKEIYDSAKRICKGPITGAGTVEYLVGQGRRSRSWRGQHAPSGRTPGHRNRRP